MKSSFELPILLLGPPGGGKSSLVHQMVEHSFNQDQLPTVGLDSQQIQIYVNKTQILLKICDTAGQSRFQVNKKSHLFEAKCVIFIFDITSEISYEQSKTLYYEQKVLAQNQESCQHNELHHQLYYLVGNKNDLIPILNFPVEEFVKQEKLKYLETTATNYESSYLLFQQIVEDYLYQIKQIHRKQRNLTTFKRKVKEIQMIEDTIFQLQEETTEIQNTFSDKQSDIQKKKTDFHLKLVLLGHAKTGKSSIHTRFFNNDYTQIYEPTLGVDYKIRLIHLDDCEGQLQIWDTTGDQQFRMLMTSYLADANGFILVYDITQRETFEELKDWAKLICEHDSKKHIGMLVGNKIDLADQRVVLTSEGQQLADQFNWQFIETSAMTSINVEILFTSISTQIINSLE